MTDDGTAKRCSWRKTLFGQGYRAERSERRSLADPHRSGRAVQLQSGTICDARRRSRWKKNRARVFDRFFALRRRTRIFYRACAARGVDAASSQIASRRRVAVPENFQGALHARFEKRKNESPFAFDCDWRRAVCQLRTHALQRLESGKFSDAGESQTFLHSGRKPQLGVRLSRRDGKVCGGSSVVQIRVDN